MWKIITNESNPAALKIVIGCKFAKKTDYCVETFVPPEGFRQWTQRLPFLDIDNDDRFFSTNGILQLLPLNFGECEETVRQWLEYDACELSPNVAFALGGKSPGHKRSLVNLLNVLENFLASIKKNEGDILIYEIAIWSTLYPLFKESELHKEYFESCPNVLQWMQVLSSKDEIKDALNEFNIASAQVSYQALLSGAKYVATSSNTPPDPVEVTTVTPEEIAAAKLAWIEGSNKLPLPKPESYPVLPIPGEKNILITAALPYVNNVPHLGNIIGCVLSGDVFARFARLCNWNTLFIGGTDEYGTATETKALEEGLTPKEICDKYFEIHNGIYRWFNIGFDYFGRTTTPEQTKLVQEMFTILHSNGFMETQPVEQLLCEKCERYLADRFVEGGCPHPGCGYEDARGDQCDGCGKLVNATELKNPRCKVCKNAPVTRISEQFFLQLNKLEPLLLHWQKTSVEGWTNNAKVITKSWMKEGLKPRCITRDLKWGIPVPVDGYRDKVFYVWFDAPLGYVSMTERYTKEWEKWWRPEKDTDVSLYQFMGKDNVPFHSVMFPGCLMGANLGYTLVSHIMATEYVNYEDGKFSKSRGVGVFGNNAQETGIPSDVWRFYLLYIRPEGQDSSFSWTDLATKNNSELLNNLGNFANRALVFTEKFFDSAVPAMYPSDEEYGLLALCTRELRSYISALEKCKLRDGIRHILAISRLGNQYMQSSQPWVLLKGTDKNKERAGTVIGICVNITCLLATLLFPYMPDASRTLRAQLNAPPESFILTPETPEMVKLLSEGHKIGKPAPLFEKLEPARVENLRKQFGGQKEEVPAAGIVANLEKAANEQAAKVRVLKATVDKTIWQPEVAILLELKKKLVAAQKTEKSAPKANKPAAKPCVYAIPVDPAEYAAVENAILEQGQVVRNLKASGAPKTEWQPQVDILLGLKKKLVDITGVEVSAPKGNK